MLTYQMDLIWNRIICIYLLTLSGISLAFFQIQPLIFGGEKAATDQFPFLVSVRYMKNGKYEHNCGAAILSDRYVLTAGHCYKSKIKFNKYRISVGAVYREEQGQLYPIKRFIVHPRYDAATKVNDIALIEMENSLDLDGKVSAIEINRNPIEGKEIAVVAGWGKSENGYTGLKYVKMTTMTNDECRKMSLPQAPIKDFTTLCAYSGNKGTGICIGDSGGPLISNNKLIGISSWGIACAKGYPDGFARISVFVPWIDQIMQKPSI